MNRPFLHYPHPRPRPLPGDIFPGIFPWDPLRLQPRQEVLIYPYIGGAFNAELLTAHHYPHIGSLPDYAFLWATNSVQIAQARLELAKHFSADYDIKRTPFGLYTFQRLPLIAH